MPAARSPAPSAIAGLVEEADGGTLFLDEVADLSARAQAKLLRVVQQHEVRRVGETFSRKVDVRFVIAPLIVTFARSRSTGAFDRTCCIDWT